ncbi:ATP-binding protein [Herbaspirillum huttiense]|uniref:AAA family ATPase n=1 Tax=Herbaspirillum huttiense TaxID=863372 RepID=UPI0010649B13|nr:AAA family ATPase [Herbaspirillum huttiense]QBP77579.1 ATP-binding protein [Herbaspirillum huttiense]
MYINRIDLQNFRTFRRASVQFLHSDLNLKQLGLPKPRFPNVNLLLGNNGAGKTTLLKAIALACLGPAVGKSGIYPYRLVRQEPIKQAGAGHSHRARSFRGKAEDEVPPLQAMIQATFTAHAQDRVPKETWQLASEVRLRRISDFEDIEWSLDHYEAWEPIFSAETDALFFVGYGATRRVEQKERYDPGSRTSRSFARALRVQSLFEDSYSLVPLNSWLPDYQHKNPGRFSQVVTLLNKLVGAGHYRFTGEMEQGEYLFEQKGLGVPFPALSDGYRAFLGWVGDLLYHICMTCPSGKKLIENCGIVMIDEIDLHLHPEWQMKLLPTLSKALPKIQFIVTSHSPLIVGSLEWMNILTMQPDRGQASKVERIKQPVHGLDADQVLLTDFFGLKSTRAERRKREIKNLSLLASKGDTAAAMALLREMSRGAESTK